MPSSPRTGPGHPGKRGLSLYGLPGKQEQNRQSLSLCLMRPAYPYSHPRRRSVAPQRCPILRTRRSSLSRTKIGLTTLSHLNIWWQRTRRPQFKPQLLQLPEPAAKHREILKGQMCKPCPRTPVNHVSGLYTLSKGGDRPSPLPPIMLGDHRCLIRTLRQPGRGEDQVLAPAQNGSHRPASQANIASGS